MATLPQLIEHVNKNEFDDPLVYRDCALDLLARMSGTIENYRAAAIVLALIDVATSIDRWVTTDR